MTWPGPRARIAAAVALPLVLVALAGWLSWVGTWARAEGELARTTDAAAEYAERVFQSTVLAARLTDSLLAGATEAEIGANEALYHDRLSRIMPVLQVSNAITVSGADGTLLLMSTVYPAPRIALADREWVQALSAPDAPALHVGALSFGRVRGNPFFSVSIPRSAPPGAAPGYAGLVNVSLDPYAVARGLATTTHEAADVLTILRSDGAILASTGSNWLNAPQVPATSPLHDAIAAGSDRGLYEGRAMGLRQGLPIGRGLLISYRRVGALPVYVTVSRPIRAILAPWFTTMAGLLAVGLPAALALGWLARIDARRRTALLDSEALFRAAFENATTGTALVDAADRRILRANRRLAEISGQPPGALPGRDLDRLVEPAGPDADGPAGARRLLRPDGQLRWVELGTAPVGRVHRGAPALLIATIHDVTERKEAEHRQQLLAREVDHRAKNVLAIVQAVIRLVRDPAARRAMQDAEGRIKALARAHELLAGDRWQGARLGGLLADELAAYRGGARIETGGPDLQLAPAAVQPLSMALHELATNAAKHGALARPEGRLTVAWTVAGDDGALVLDWTEVGGPPPAVPDPDGGSGLAILAASVAQLGGTVRRDWRPQGLACTIRLPARVLQPGAGGDAAGAGNGPAAAGAAHRPAPRPPGAGPGPAGALPPLRVIVAEDELLVALDTAEILRGLGCTVIGPAQTLAEAERLAAAEAGAIDVALFDVNLAGRSSLPLARRLAAGGMPCIFATGYSDLPDAAPGEDWILLRKPVAEAELTAALRTAADRLAARAADGTADGAADGAADPAPATGDAADPGVAEGGDRGGGGRPQAPA